jgi:ribosomal protein L37AE/L43A
MAIYVVSKAWCSKCRKKSAERLGMDGDKAVWECKLCEHRFHISILKMTTKG